jgi:hypothetical protein
VFCPIVLHGENLSYWLVLSSDASLGSANTCSMPVRVFSSKPEFLWVHIVNCPYVSDEVRKEAEAVCQERHYLTNVGKRPRRSEEMAASVGGPITPHASLSSIELSVQRER